MLKQVATDSTVSVSDALGEITDEPKAVKFTANGNRYFVRASDREGHQYDYLVNIPVDVMDTRKVVTVEDTGAVEEAIRTAETAIVVPIRNTPWSGTYEADNEADYDS